MENGQGNVLEMWAKRLELEAGLQAQLAIEVAQLDAEQLKTGLVQILKMRADLMQSLRDGLVTTGDPSLVMIAQLAAAGADTQIASLREIVQAVRGGVGQLQVDSGPRVSLS